MRYAKAILAVVACLAGSAGLTGTGQADQPKKARPADKADRWEAWRGLVGTWKGTSEGRPGKGTVTLVVGFVLGERYLKMAGTADYRSAKGASRHEDFGFVSFDRGRSKFVFRQFHVEGFVNQYTLTNDPKADDKIVLTSESCENAPPGMRARETYKLSGDTLEHTFELAAPGKPFQRYAAATLKREKPR
jgi:hypothetical protein